MSTQTNPSLFSTKLVFGLAVIALGVALMLDNFRLYEGWRLLAWWPLVLAAFGVAHLLRNGFLSLGGHVWLAFAVAGFLQQFGPWGLLDRWWPVFLVWGGLIVTLRAVFPKTTRGQNPVAAPPSPVPTESCDAEFHSKQGEP